jgi:hypothetical protein
MSENLPNSGPGVGPYASILTPAAALATPVDVVWYSDSTNRSAESSLGLVIDEIIGSSFSSSHHLPSALQSITIDI